MSLPVQFPETAYIFGIFFHLYSQESYTSPPTLPSHISSDSLLLSSSTFFKIFIYLFMTERERERASEKQREKQALCREPDTGLDPRAPGSYPREKATLNRWATGAALFGVF